MHLVYSRYIVSGHQQNCTAWPYDKDDCASLEFPMIAVLPSYYADVRNTSMERPVLFVVVVCSLNINELININNTHADSQLEDWRGIIDSSSAEPVARTWNQLPLKIRSQLQLRLDIQVGATFSSTTWHFTASFSVHHDHIVSYMLCKGPQTVSTRKWVYSLASQLTDFFAVFPF